MPRSWRRTGRPGRTKAMPRFRSPGTVALLLGALATLCVGRRLLPGEGRGCDATMLLVVLAGGLLMLAADANAFVIKNVGVCVDRVRQRRLRGVLGRRRSAIPPSWARATAQTQRVDQCENGSGRSRLGWTGRNEGNNYLKFEVDTPGANVRHRHQRWSHCDDGHSGVDL